MLIRAVLVLAAGAAHDAPAPGPRPEDLPAVDAVVVVRDFGEFRVRLHRDEAPNHVAQFLTLATSGYYDEQSFHRVIPGYLIQTGDPSSRDDDLRNDGSGGPDVRLPEEPVERTHRRGTLSMAWRGDVSGTAASQWFVVLSDVPALDGRATPIGEVVSGMEVVDRISQVSTHRSRNPLSRVVIETIRLEPAAPAGAGSAD
ncbi:MAG: peptidylprolyl isomerase [Candidatus Eiseniibacteriota bacterium]